MVGKGASEKEEEAQSNNKNQKAYLDSGQHLKDRKEENEKKKLLLLKSGLRTLGQSDRASQWAWS